MERESHVYQSGDCTVVSYGPYHHELLWRHEFVANFHSFRDAVKYLHAEFG